MRVLHVLDHSPDRERLQLPGQPRGSAAARARAGGPDLAEAGHASRRPGARRRTPLPHRTGEAPSFVREVALMWKVAARLVEVARRTGRRRARALAAPERSRPCWRDDVYACRPSMRSGRSGEDAAVSHGTFREGSVRYRISRALETLVLRRADRVVAICEGIRRGRGPGRGSGADRRRPERGGAGLARASPASELAGGRLGIGRGPVCLDTWARSASTRGYRSWWRRRPISSDPPAVAIYSGRGRSGRSARSRDGPEGRASGDLHGPGPRSRLRTSTRCWMCWCCRAGGPG